MKQLLSFFALLLFFTGCNSEKEKQSGSTSELEKITLETFPDPVFGISEANKLIELPLHCVETEYPNKLGQTIGGDSDLLPPRELHPIFYGCFDWHSSVHGYWSMVSLLKDFPDLEKAQTVRDLLKRTITEENVSVELSYFEKKINTSYERTYGWAWLLKLAETLHLWDDPMSEELEMILKPLTNLIVERYKEFLPKLVYPIRVGEHTNTAFGLTFAYDYALATRENELQVLIEQRAKDFYMNDANCPITWEPSGFDFLSPCFEEMDLMRRVLPEDEFLKWLDEFFPDLKNDSYHLSVGEVRDRTDGKLVHLDGLNFSRAWSLYGLAGQYPQYDHVKNLANEHVQYALPNLVGDSYEGGHWLGSFAIYALNTMSTQ